MTVRPSIRSLEVPNSSTPCAIASDSDEPYLQPTNRGNKLKRKAHCLGDRLAGGPNGLKIYKKVGFRDNDLHNDCGTDLS